MSYTEFDQRMLSLIESGSAVTASALTLALKAEATKFSAKEGEEFRVIDRRLQALRKKKLIECEQIGRFMRWKKMNNSPLC